MDYLSTPVSESKYPLKIQYPKEPNVIMNDYTKNISSSIFTPGVFRGNTGMTHLQKKFIRGKSAGVNRIKAGTAEKGQLDTDPAGMKVLMKGRLGEKHITVHASPFASKVDLRSKPK